MASFVDPSTGGKTTDHVVHLFRLLNLGDEALTDKLSTWQQWVGVTVIGGITMISWSGLVSLWLEVMEVDKPLLDRCSITWVPAPEDVAKAIAAAVDTWPGIGGGPNSIIERLENVGGGATKRQPGQGGLYVGQGAGDQLSHHCLQLGLLDVPLPLQPSELGLLSFRAPGWSKAVKCNFGGG